MVQLAGRGEAGQQAGAAPGAAISVAVLAPEGFMPSFAGNSLAIVPCPGEEEVAPGESAAMAGMAMPSRDSGHHHDHNHFAQVCPYTAAASLAGLDTAVAALPIRVSAAMMPPLARALPQYRRTTTRDRPPAQGPPAIA